MNNITTYLKGIFCTYNVGTDHYIRQTINNQTYNDYEYHADDNSDTLFIHYDDFKIGIWDEYEIEFQRDAKFTISIRNKRGKLMMSYRIDGDNKQYMPKRYEVSKECLLDIYDVYEGIMSNQNKQ